MHRDFAGKRDGGQVWVVRLMIGGTKRFRHLRFTPDYGKSGEPHYIDAYLGVLGMDERISWRCRGCGLRLPVAIGVVVQAGRADNVITTSTA